VARYGKIYANKFDDFIEVYSEGRCVVDGFKDLPLHFVVKFNALSCSVCGDDADGDDDYSPTDDDNGDDNYSPSEDGCCSGYIPYIDLTSISRNQLRNFCADVDESINYMTVAAYASASPSPSPSPESALDDFSDAGAEDCYMATPNGLECRLKLTLGDIGAMFSMKELDNREFEWEVSGHEGGFQSSSGNVKVSTNGAICLDGSQDTSASFTCSKFLQQYTIDEGATEIELISIDDYPCTDFAKSLFYYLINLGLDDTSQSLLPSANSTTSDADNPAPSPEVNSPTLVSTPQPTIDILVCSAPTDCPEQCCFHKTLQKCQCLPSSSTHCIAYTLSGAPESCGNTGSPTKDQTEAPSKSPSLPLAVKRETDAPSISLMPETSVNKTSRNPTPSPTVMTKTLIPTPQPTLDTLACRAPTDCPKQCCFHKTLQKCQCLPSTSTHCITYMHSGAPESCGNTGSPTKSPTESPRATESDAPLISTSPGISADKASNIAWPSTIPTVVPTPTPTSEPTGSPTSSPASKPVSRPSQSPSIFHTTVPTYMPSTSVPTTSPTLSHQPSRSLGKSKFCWCMQFMRDATYPICFLVFSYSFLFTCYHSPNEIWQDRHSTDLKHSD